jgi:restriction endonuclease Mrr
MATFLIAISLLIIFLILDRVHNILRHRREIARAERDAALSVLKIVIKQELLRLKDPELMNRWITRLLEMLGYSDVKQNILNEESGYDFTCLEKGRKVLIACKLQKARDYEEPLTTGTVQKLVGAMVGDRVKKGLLLTTGELTEEARRYIERLPVSYKITVLDGQSLMEKIHDLRKLKLVDLLES